jgi:hypothetical protein
MIFLFFGKLIKKGFFGNDQACYQYNAGNKVRKRRIPYKKPLLCTQKRTPSTGRGSTRPASVGLTAFSKSYL